MNIKDTDNVNPAGQVFATGRFMMELRRAFLSRRRAILLGAVVIVSAVFLISFFVQYVAIKNWAYLYDRHTDDSDVIAMCVDQMKYSVPREQALFFAVIMIVGGCAASAMMFGSLVTRGERVSALMVPASQFEKFLAQWVIFVPCFLAVFFVATVAADLMRPLLFGIFAPPWMKLFTSLHLVATRGALMAGVRLLALYVLVSSFFGLGAVAWPRHSALKTIGLVTVLAIAVPLWALVWHVALGVRGEPFAEFGSSESIWAIITIIGVGNWVLTWLALTETDLKTV